MLVLSSLVQTSLLLTGLCCVCLLLIILFLINDLHAFSRFNRQPRAQAEIDMTALVHEVRGGRE
jgi:hypothetical protein